MQWFDWLISCRFLASKDPFLVDLGTRHNDSNAKILEAMSIINQSQCDNIGFNVKVIKNLMSILNHNHWLVSMSKSITCLHGLNIIYFFIRVKSFEKPLNVSVNCFLDLNVNLNCFLDLNVNLNYLEITNSMLIVNAIPLKSQYHPQKYCPYLFGTTDFNR